VDEVAELKRLFIGRIKKDGEHPPTDCEGNSESNDEGQP
jgi:hypothetical protein